MFSFAAVTRYSRVPVSHRLQKKSAAKHLWKLWASRKARRGLLGTSKLCAESTMAILLWCFTGGRSYICKPKKPRPHSNCLDELAKSQADFWQKSFLWLIGSSLNGISERYFCFKELTTSDAGMSHWKIPNCFPIFFLTIMIIWQFPSLAPWSSLHQGKSGVMLLKSLGLRWQKIVIEGNWGSTLTLDSWMNVYKVFFLSFRTIGKYGLWKRIILKLDFTFCDFGVSLQQFFLDSLLIDQ